MKNRIYCTFILSIIAVMVCAQTEQPKDSIKRQRETVPEIRQELHINDIILGNKRQQIIT